MEIMKLDKPLNEAHFEFDPKWLSAPKRNNANELYGGTKLAREIWAEWRPIFTGANKKLAAIKRLATKLGDTGNTVDLCNKYIKELRNRNLVILDKLENTTTNTQQELRAIVDNVNKFLREVTKLIKASDKNLDQLAKEKLDSADTPEQKKEVEQDIKEAEAEAQEAGEVAEKQAEKETADAGSKQQGDGEKSDAGAAGTKKSAFADELAALVDGDNDALISAALGYIDSEVGKTNPLYSLVKAGNDKSIGLANTLRDIVREFDNRTALSKFINVVAKRTPIDKVDKSFYTNLEVLADSIVNNRFNDSNSAIGRVSLFNRPRAEFNYALELFNIVADDNKLKSYFPDLTPMMLERFKAALVDGDKVKPSGNTSKDPTDKTLHGLVEIFGKVQKKAKGTVDSDEKTETKSKSGVPVFKNFEDAKKSGANTVMINGKFRYNKDKDAWEPA